MTTASASEVIIPAFLHLSRASGPSGGVDLNSGLTQVLHPSTDFGQVPERESKREGFALS
ncbi:hypothetical protein ACF09H_13360 [Streptomyces sp. NPDC014983]|uniref:hypothetical protein n=1 Tax=unclassified Streptomyces TaxID=2593676 RepID=UPI003331972A